MHQMATSCICCQCGEFSDLVVKASVRLSRDTGSIPGSFSRVSLVVLISVPKLTLSVCVSQKFLMNCHPNENRLVILRK